MIFNMFCTLIIIEQTIVKIFTILYGDKYYKGKYEREDRDEEKHSFNICDGSKSV